MTTWPALPTSALSGTSTVNRRHPGANARTGVQPSRPPTATPVNDAGAVEASPPYGPAQPPPLPPARPSRWPLVVTIVVALVAASGLVTLVVTDDSDTASTAPAELDIADMERALLTEEDVGGGFTVDEDNDGEEEGFLSSEEIDASAECREAIARFQADEDDDEIIEIGFEHPTSNAGVGHEITLIDPGEPTMGDVADGLGRCGTMAFEDDGAQFEIDLTVADLEGPGEEALGVAMITDVTSPAYDLTLDTYVIMAARDGVVSIIDVTGPIEVSPPTESASRPPEGGPADRELARRLAETADERIRRVLEG